MAKKEYEDEDIRLFEIYAKWTRNINYARAWAWMNDEAKERLIAKYPWTFPILAKPKSNVRRQVKIEGKRFGKGNIIFVYGLPHYGMKFYFLILIRRI